MSPLLQSPLTIEHALLGFLRQSPMHGYEIYQRMSDPGGLGVVWHLKQSLLYALLAKLERAGYVTAVLEPQDARPPRKIFHLTSTGETMFLDWVQNPVAHGRDIRLDFLVKLYFARQEGEIVVAHLLERQHTTCQNWLTQQQALADSLSDTQSYEWLICQFRIGQIQAMISWLTACQV